MKKALIIGATRKGNAHITDVLLQKRLRDGSQRARSWSRPLLSAPATIKKQPRAKAEACFKPFVRIMNGTHVKALSNT